MYGTAWRLITAVLTTTVHTYHMYVHVHYSIVTLVVVEKRKNIFYFCFVYIGEKMIGKKVYFLREARLFSVLS